MIINSPLLLQTNISDHQITQTVRECVYLSDPGPHVIVLLLKHEQCSAEDQECVKKVLHSFSERVYQHTMVISTQEHTETNDILQKIIQKCAKRHFILHEGSSPDDLLQTFDDIVQMNDGQHLDCEGSQNFVMTQQPTERYVEKINRRCCMNNKHKRLTHLRTEKTMDPGFKEKNKEKCDVTSSSETHCLSGRRSPNYDRPNMSDLRIVLLGKSVSENSGVGNLILGQAEFDSKAPPDVVQRVGGRLKDRHVIIINSPQLLQRNISDHQITQRVRECVNLSDPGPHVIVLLLKHEQCSAEDQECVEKVLLSFSEQVYQHTMVITTQEPTETNDILQKIIQKCANRHFSLHEGSSHDDLLQMFEDIVQMNNGWHLICAEDSQSFNIKQHATEKISKGEKLNLVVCGTNRTFKSSISKRILQQTDSGSDLELHRSLNSLVELPALFNTQLSEEEVMRQALRCVSLCHPGVHVFLLIIPDAPLNNEDKAEMEEIQRIFSSRINKHIMILIMQNSEHQTAELTEETQSVIQSFGGQYHVFGPKTQVSTLMKKIEQMLKENRGKVFSTETFLDAQMKKLLQFDEMEKKIHSLETHFLLKAEREDVMLRKTEVGKSTKEENKILMERVEQTNREREELMKKHEEDKKRIKMMMIEEERQNQEKREREEQYKREIKEEEDQMRGMQQMRDQEEWERQKQEERQKEDEKWKAKEEIQRLMSEIEGMIRENERIEREKQAQVEDLETRLKEERNIREDQQKTFEEKLKLFEEQYEDELKRKQVEWREEYEREKEEMKKICSGTDDSLQNAYTEKKSCQARQARMMHRQTFKKMI
ncbi:hypothetical protein Q8A67_001347 [Cirrhinus molitorella]|uniref:AIG1-type G domain-containing protein n=1 Tax=Cirrhinus molitorella TaxID=172907 RepID=A0AA88TYM9_9TELE|nr:hypothetical protein Q8A67_001347 [Cirrhinus molitorella]